MDVQGKQSRKAEKKINKNAGSAVASRYSTGSGATVLDSSVANRFHDRFGCQRLDPVRLRLERIVDVMPNHFALKPGLRANVSA